MAKEKTYTFEKYLFSEVVSCSKCLFMKDQGETGN